MTSAHLRVLAAGVGLLLVACGAQTDIDATLTSERLRARIDAAGLRIHMEALQAIAQDHGGIRASGTSGYHASAEYVAERLRDAGYEPALQEFEFPWFEEVTPPSISVGGGPALAGIGDLSAMIFSASGDVRGEVSVLGFDPQAQPGPFRGVGCEAEDWSGFDRGSVALVQPGPCLRREQVLNAQAAGAAAIVVAYPGWRAGEVRRPTLIDPGGIEIPALAATREAGVTLAEVAEAGEEVLLTVGTRVEPRSTVNVLAELRGTGQEAIVLGAHLDSVLEGPGINDNGSGVAAVLELAAQSAGLRSQRTQRFAFWSAEELGVLGSTHYVDSLSTGEADEIRGYLNLDMLGSPNGARYMYADEDAPPGSDEISRLFNEYFRSHGLDSEPLDLGGASDHGPFMRAGIAVGGVFSGAGELKTEQQAARDGGSAGEPHDACYHLACDDLDNVDLELAAELADAAAHALAELAGRLPE